MRIKSKIIFIVLTVIIILFSGCVSTEFTPSTPAKKTPSLNVYGKLLDYSQDDLTIFKIQPEFINYELNNTYLEIEAKTEELYNFTDYCLRFMSRNLSLTEEECKNRLYQEYNLSQKCRSVIEVPERGSFYLKCDLKFDLIKGNNYAFYFSKIDENGPWTGVVVSENLTEYKERGSYYHKDDLTYSFIRETIPSNCTEEAGQACLVQLVELIFNKGETGKIQINLTNKQDNELSFNIDAKVVDYYKLEPNIAYCPPEGYLTSRSGERETCIPKTFEEKLKDAVIDSCSVSYLSNYSIEPKTSKALDFSVMCNEPLNCIKEPHYPNRTCSLVLYVNLSWTDELGNSHSKANDYFVPTFYIK